MTRRGLTLVEVLASAVLLAMVAATCVPLLRRVSAALDPPARVVTLHELAAVADVLSVDPDAIEAGVAEIPWPDDTGRPPIAVRRLEAAEADHAWILYSCDGWTVSRWNAGGAEEAEGGEREPQP